MINPNLTREQEKELQKKFLFTIHSKKDWITNLGNFVICPAGDFLDTPYMLKGEKEGNIYFSVHSIKPHHRRNQNNIERFTCLIADLDKTELNLGLTPVETYQKLETLWDKMSIPKPTIIVMSGHGLHLYWVFKQQVKGTAAKKYLKMEAALGEKFKEFGFGACFDTTVSTDTARVLRIPYTVNRKPGQDPVKVVILDFHGVKYDFRELSEILLGPDKGKAAATEKQLKWIARIEAARGEKFPDSYKKNIENASKTIRLNKHLIDTTLNPITAGQQDYVSKICRGLNLEYPEDITTSYDADKWIKLHRAAYEHYVITKKASNHNHKILNHRTARRGISGEYDPDMHVIKTLERYVEENPDNHTGNYREVTMYFYRTACANVYGLERAAEMMLELNAKYDEPFKESYILTATKSVNDYHEKAARGEDEIRCYHIQTVALRLTGDKHGLEPYYVTPKKDRREEQHDYYVNVTCPKNNKTEYKQVKAQKLEQTMDYIIQGKSVKEMVSLLGVEKSTVYNYIKEIKATHPELFECKPNETTEEIEQTVERPVSADENKIPNFSTPYLLLYHIFDVAPAAVSQSAYNINSDATTMTVFEDCYSDTVGIGRLHSLLNSMMPNYSVDTLKEIVVPYVQQQSQGELKDYWSKVRAIKDCIEKLSQAEPMKKKMDSRLKSLINLDCVFINYDDRVVRNVNRILCSIPKLKNNIILSVRKDIEHELIETTAYPVDKFKEQVSALSPDDIDYIITELSKDKQVLSREKYIYDFFRKKMVYCLQEIEKRKHTDNRSLLMA